MAGALMLLSLSACDQSPKHNVLIVTLDTTRADHIGAYGDEEAMTPVIDQLAREGILFEQAITPIPITCLLYTSPSPRDS